MDVQSFSQGDEWSASPSSDLVASNSYYRAINHRDRQPWGFQENRVQSNSTPSILKVSYRPSLLPLYPYLIQFPLHEKETTVVGFLVIESFSSSEEIDAMRRRMDQLLDGFDHSAAASIFSTKNQVSLFSTSIPSPSTYSASLNLSFCFCFLFQQQLTNDYFHESAEKISFFFEGTVLSIIWGKASLLRAILCFGFD